MKASAFISINVLIISQVASSDVGENCILNHNGASGVCVSSYQCPSALYDLHARNVRPTICSFEGLDSIICCEFFDDGSEEDQDTTSVDYDPDDSGAERPDGDESEGNGEHGDATEDSDESTGVDEKPVSSTGADEENVSSTGVDEEPVFATQVDIRKNQPIKRRISEKICDEYRDCYVYLQVTEGVDAKKNEFMHMAAIGWPKNDGTVAWNCGGSLISERFVVTAGHCTSNPKDTTLNSSTPTVVRLGDWNLNSESDDYGQVQDIQIEAIVKHPSYKPPSKYHDLALVKLAKDAKLQSGTKPCCLWQSMTLPSNATPIVTGWGSVVHMGKTADILQRADLKFVNNSACREVHTQRRRTLDRGIDDDIQICAGDPIGGRDTCQGDSGGPLQLPEKGYPCSYRLVGVTSFGKGCGEHGVPGVYTRISAYLDWIEEVVWPGM